MQLKGVQEGKMCCEKTQADVAQEVFCPHRRISAVAHVVKLPEFLTYLYRLVTFGRRLPFRNDPFNSLHLPRAQPSPVAFNTSSHWTPLPLSALLLLCTVFMVVIHELEAC